MLSFFSKQKTAFGLDVSGTTLRMMQLAPLGKGWFPSAFSESDMPKGAIADDKIQNKEAFVATLAESLKHPAFGQFESPYVVVSVPEAKSFVRIITVAAMTEAEAQEALPIEAEQYIPVSLDQVYMDYRIIPEGRGKKPAEKMHVLICATPKNVVDDYLETLRQARLVPVAVEVESEAVARCLIDPSRTGEATLILDLSSVHTSMLIYDQGSLQFTSSVPLAGNAFSSQIAQHLGVSQEEAERLKIQIGLLAGRDGGKVRAAILPLLASLQEAIRNTMTFYREHSEDGREITKILLCGGGAKLRGLSDYLAQALSKTPGAPSGNLVAVGDPWCNVLERPYKKVPPISKADSIGYTTVIGLALRAVKLE